MEIIILKNLNEATNMASDIITKEINKNSKFVLGLSAGSTMIPLYRKLVNMYNSGSTNFNKVISFNLDEYVGIEEERFSSFEFFMKKNFFDKINIKSENINFPSLKNLQLYDEYIDRCGGFDLVILGIGRNGHIAFNEPGSSFNSETRIVKLAEKTRKDNSKFFNSLNEVPNEAITVGIKTILKAKKIVIIASGISKSNAVSLAIEGRIRQEIPASVLQRHTNSIFIIDKGAASKLKKRKNL